MDKIESRRVKMVSILKDNHNFTIAEMAEKIGVSEMTIRRDLKSLVLNNSIKVVNGVIIYMDSPSSYSATDYELSSESIKHIDEKTRIGKFAATLIEPEEIIIIDGGTTTERMIPFIDDNINITALCYNCNILFNLYKKSNISLIVAGGYYHPATDMLESSSGIQLIKEVRANKLFLSCAGIHETLGITTAESYESLAIKTAIDSSNKKILLTDSSKFGLLRAAYITQLSNIDMVITDDGLSNEWRNIINELGVSLKIV